jgi:hypothetical protein
MYSFYSIAIYVVSWQTWSLIGLQNRGEESRGFCHIIVLFVDKAISGGVQGAWTGERRADISSVF